MNTNKKADSNLWNSLMNHESECEFFVPDEREVIERPLGVCLCRNCRDKIGKGEEVYQILDRPSNKYFRRSCFEGTKVAEVDYEKAIEDFFDSVDDARACLTIAAIPHIDSAGLRNDILSHRTDIPTQCKWDYVKGAGYLSGPRKNLRGLGTLIESIAKKGSGATLLYEWVNRGGERIIGGCEVLPVSDSIDSFFHECALAKAKLTKGLDADVLAR